MIARLIISPSLENRVLEINKILSESNLSFNHPDLLYFTTDSKLGIAEARKIKVHFSFKSFNGKVRAVALEDASNLTVEAQNALLKTLEELPVDGLFILGADSESKLLPTVLSRCEIIRVQGTGDRGQEKDLTKDLEMLLKSDIQQRFEYVEKLKERQEFLHSMILYFHQKLTEPDTHAGGRPFGSEPQGRRLARLNEFLKELVQAEEWAQQNVNIRAILEYLMLVMPQNV